MSGVYIPGMEMPKGLGKTITIYPNGAVRVWVNNKGSGELLEQRAVPVPDHGDLIDRNALIDDMANMIPWVIESPEEIAMVDGLSNGYEAAKAAPTIIPADKEGNE